MKTTRKNLDVVIVGAGAAGVGCGVVLHDLGIKNFVILERDRVGATFSRWSAEMRFITPSFPSHGFGLLDLNAVVWDTSPAIAFKREHLTGKEYALYLQTVVDYYHLPVQTGVDVQKIDPLPQQQGFLLKTSAGEIRCRFVIWAAGEFQYPRLHPFPGAELCIHNSQVSSWREIPGDEFLIVGGYESGMDAATNLVALGKRVRVIDRATSWANDHTDPSISLSPYTVERLKIAYSTGLLELVNDTCVEEVKRVKDGYAVYSEYNKWMSLTPPILCTGFTGSLSLIANLFSWQDGQALLTAQDESTRTPGLFVVGPSVRHGQVIFCFIYKFRQRFAVVAEAIAYRMGLDTSPLDVYRQNGLFLEDLSCCGNDCIC
ncbi:NAD(P)/FAD-dependent oxidoreductase [Chroococcidiopsis sp. CCNUC1]|uniref:NAD(P)/FAD-dependent oxidoreductase n=1 Tax=Chroococcidiopsis sp. CCNUC1 TaxID=2653189 RepID=UPI002022763A|nr:NAD(P)/FAD-dependent oxidoreductase [Chroococcidiopsis sp. CCNUC1]URD48459.1 NAD(P)-binding domain-containing protein [Chroococcidiopsis sp. CCNUC1]